jgi:hypothetical protein
MNFALPRWVGIREIVTLGQIAPHDRQAVHLLAVLHSFGGHREPQSVRKVHDQAHDRVVRRILPQTIDK